ncbi:hypothetical protein QV13_07155 [Mesorhizobium hungaricum]|jgi:hypothetical protein|uniref:Uncharacterized protein n=1 Tax=Mesorhizobium hungaricum TaxID=1566387 RepID=A0A1C2E3E2_9HYPH|nr:hypothetical protein QV13_07155 [Mesorhizobium hungaricum]
MFTARRWGVKARADRINVFMPDGNWLTALAGLGCTGKECDAALSRPAGGLPVSRMLVLETHCSSSCIAVRQQA